MLETSFSLSQNGWLQWWEKHGTHPDLCLHNMAISISNTEYFIQAIPNTFDSVSWSFHSPRDDRGQMILTPPSDAGDESSDEELIFCEGAPSMRSFSSTGSNQRR